MGPTALLPLRRKWCSGFLSPLKIHRPRSGSNPRTLGPVASTLTTSPPRSTMEYIHPGYSCYSYTNCGHVIILFSSPDILNVEQIVGSHYGTIVPLVGVSRVSCFFFLSFLPQGFLSLMYAGPHVTLCHLKFNVRSVAVLKVFIAVMQITDLQLLLCCSIPSSIPNKSGYACK
jgi:hypothetical protein